MRYFPRTRRVLKNPFPTWHADREGPYENIPSACGEIEIPIYTCPAEDDGAFVHHPMLIQKAGKIFLMWSEHSRDEDAGGMRTMWSISRNNGCEWDDPGELQERLSDIIYDGDAGTNWAARPTAWCDVDSGLFAVLDVFVHLKAGEIGVLAVPVDPDTEAIGTPVWIWPDTALTTPGAYPQYSIASAQVKFDILQDLATPENPPRWTSGSFTYFGQGAIGQKSEPCGITTPPPYSQAITLWRGPGLSTNKYADVRLTYTSVGAVFYQETNIPDDPSTGAIRLLSDGKLGYISNDARDAEIRERLFYVEFDPANWQLGKHSPVYNVAEDSDVVTFYTGLSKVGQPGYADFIEVGDYIITAYSVRKQDIRVTRFRRPSRLRYPVVFS